MPNDLPSAYEHDAFISYTWTEPVGSWVTKYFVPQLREWLGLELGEPPRLFIDRDHLVPGKNMTPTIRRHLLASRCVIPIWSLYYFRSRWCVAEWKTFRMRQDALGLSENSLLAPVLFQRKTELFPPEAQGGGRPIFADFSDYNHIVREDTDLFERFRVKLKAYVAGLAGAISAAPNFRADWPVCSDFDITAMLEDPQRRLEASRWCLLGSPQIPKPSFPVAA